MPQCHVNLTPLPSLQGKADLDDSALMRQGSLLHQGGYTAPVRLPGRGLLGAQGTSPGFATPVGNTTLAVTVTSQVCALAECFQCLAGCSFSPPPSPLCPISPGFHILAPPHPPCPSRPQLRSPCWPSLFRPPPPFFSASTHFCPAPSAPLSPPSAGNPTCPLAWHTGCGMGAQD